MDAAEGDAGVGFDFGAAAKHGAGQALHVVRVDVDGALGASDAGLGERCADHRFDFVKAFAKLDVQELARELFGKARGKGGDLLQGFVARGVDALGGLLHEMTRVGQRFAAPAPERIVDLALNVRVEIARQEANAGRFAREE